MGSRTSISLSLSLSISPTVLVIFGQPTTLLNVLANCITTIRIYGMTCVSYSRRVLVHPHLVNVFSPIGSQLDI